MKITPIHIYFRISFLLTPYFLKLSLLTQNFVKLPRYPFLSIFSTQLILKHHNYYFNFKFYNSRLSLPIFSQFHPKFSKFTILPSNFTFFHFSPFIFIKWYFHITNKHEITKQPLFWIQPPSFLPPKYFQIFIFILTLYQHQTTPFSFTKSTLLQQNIIIHAHIRFGQPMNISSNFIFHFIF